MTHPTHPDAKLATLREQGTVNPHPEAVTDELFRTHEWFDPRDLVQVKYEMIRRVRPGWTRSGRDVEHVRSIYRETGAPEAARVEIARSTRRAERSLSGLPGTRGTSALVWLSQRLRERSS